MPELLHVPEPTLLFGYEQAIEDPRDGLTMFGPLDAGRPYGIRAGAIGTSEGLRRFRTWVRKIQKPVTEPHPSVARPPFPGFEAAFGIPWNPNPTVEIAVPDEELAQTMYLDDRHVRVYRTVEVFSRRIIQALRDEDAAVDVWFVIIPDDVYRYGRPLAQVEADVRLQLKDRLSPKYARQLRTQPALFPEDNVAAQPYHYDVHFHNQLKARLLQYNTSTQIIRESTIAHNEFVDRFGNPTRKLDDSQSAIAWNLSTAAFYKSGGRPWKLAAIRQNVCYIGLTFKVDQQSADPRSACCAAQMFLDSGDGVVFKGAVGPWYNPKRGDFHLSRTAAREIVAMAIESYVARVGHPPLELFLHGKVRFNDDEWRGFNDARGTATQLVGVRIRQDSDLKLYRRGEYPILRGESPREKWRV